MTRVIYLDCASGISGDMMLGALVDAGADLETIQKGIDSLGLPSCRFEREEVKRHAFRATKIHVRHEPEHAHRHLHHITDMIDASTLTPSQQDLAKRIFTRLGEAEAKVHGSTLQKVHFHEVGAVDSIADIVGTAIGLDLLQPDRVHCAPVPTGSGTIEIAHGRCSVPAPATAELLRGVPLAASVVTSELTTPTGAAIVATVVDEFGPLPAMMIDAIGYGAGDKDFKEQANVLRLLLGHSHHDVATGLEADQITVLETNLDDVTGEVIGYCTDQLLTAGALDVFSTPIFMKKGRPATKITVLSRPSDAARLQQILQAETYSLGVRRWQADRSLLPREPATSQTPWGEVKGKRVAFPGGRIGFFPEFEDCRRLADEHRVPLQWVLDAAKRVEGE